MELAQRYRNLVAIPSCHYHPVFGREVFQSVASFKPNAIALEISEVWADEFAWGVSLSPSPVVSYANRCFLPVVAGDSMVEGCRLGKQLHIPVFFVDLELADPIKRPKLELLPDAALAPRVGTLFLEAADALETSAGSPAEGDVMREAHMSARLAHLMKRYERVLWIGGMAHWSRIRNRLKAGAFDGPRLKEARVPRSFKRMRLESSALHRMTYRLPFQAACYSRRPARYEESECMRELALAAVHPEKCPPIDIASMLLYARNLEAQEHLSESPGLWQLLTAAYSCIGNKYAARLATLALRDRFTHEAERYPVLTHTVAKRGKETFAGVYRCDGKTLVGEPLGGYPGGLLAYRRLPSPEEIERRKRNNPASELQPAGRKAKAAWAAHPDDERAYEAFVRYVLERLSSQDPEATTPVRFAGGMGAGLDIRATIRHWHEAEFYVREPERAPARVRNGLIDYTSRSEDSWILQKAALGPSTEAPYRGAGRGGWIDPDLENVGSASWTVRGNRVLQEKPFHMTNNFRELSLITLDAPTWLKSDKSRSFFNKVIVRLLDLPPWESNLYGWLRIMFDFCRNKPFAYCSSYRPGPRVHAIAREFGVRIIHVPLRRIPRRMLERHQCFHFMWLTRSQYEELLARNAESKSAWIAAET